MNNIVIDVENISKKYSLGELHKQHGSIREKISMMLRKKSINTEHPSIWALKDISFQLAQGDILGIIGNNGAGKSTLLKILSGITKPTSGKATIYGRVRTLLEVGTGFHVELTGRENIYLNGSILGMRKWEVKKKFDEIVDFSGIEPFIDTPIKRYSSGMHLRLAFAVAAFLESEILLADEVLAVGDIDFQKKCIGKMSDAVKDGRTIIFVSHQMPAIRSLCPKVIWLDKGKVIKDGECNKIVNEYEERQLKNIDDFGGKIFRKDKDKINTVFYVDNVQILDQYQNQNNCIKYKDNLTILLELSGVPPSYSYSVEYRIYGKTDSIIQDYNLLSVGASGFFNNEYFEKNVKKVRIDIGPLMLSSGDYSISFSLVSGGQRTDVWEQACMFRIVECKPTEKSNEVYSAGCILKNTFSAVN